MGVPYRKIDFSTGSKVKIYSMCIHDLQPIVLSNLHIVKSETLSQQLSIWNFWILSPNFYCEPYYSTFSFLRYNNCFWDSTSIIVRDVNVTVMPPYKPENCQGDPKAIDQIKKLVSSHWLANTFSLYNIGSIKYQPTVKFLFRLKSSMMNRQLHLRKFC